MVRFSLQNSYQYFSFYSARVSDESLDDDARLYYLYWLAIVFGDYILAPGSILHCAM